MNTSIYKTQYRTIYKREERDTEEEWMKLQMEGKRENKLQGTKTLPLCRNNFANECMNTCFTKNNH